MAQTTINGFFAVRKRATNHGSVKRRKLTEDSRLDIPVLEDGDDDGSIPLTQPEKVEATTSKSGKGRQRRGVTRSRKAKGSKEQSLRVLLKNTAGLNGQTALDNCEESPLPGTLPSPHKCKLHFEPNTPSKARRLEDGSFTPKPSPFKTPQASPMRGVTTRAKISPFRFTATKAPSPKPSPAKTPPRVESRGAALVRLAREKNSSPARPSNTPGVDIERVTRTARRRLLTNPSSQPPGPSRDEINKLAQPTPHEAARPSSPRLNEFEAFKILSPNKSSSRQPAYRRYQSLTQPTPVPSQPPPALAAAAASVDLPLPHNYQVLAEKFRCTDTVVTMLQKRKEICSFEKLQKSVQQMTRRTFEERNLAQMKTVYPTAFVFRQENHIPGNYDQRKRERYQLTVEYNTSEEGEGGMGHLSTTALIRRRRVFRNNLTHIVKGHHQAFLSSLDPPLHIPEEKVLRWHPSFPLDSIPEVKEAQLPTPPITETYTTAKDVLNAARGKMAPRVQQALANVAGETGRKEEEEGPDKAVSTIQTDPSLKGVSQELLEKIRRKEASKAEATITRDPLKEKRLEMLGRLPEYCRILRNFFVAEKKAAISWDDVVQKLTESHGSGLTPDRVEEHLHYLKELLPNWVHCVTIRKRHYVKVTKNTDVKDITKQLEIAQRQLKKL